MCAGHCCNQPGQEQPKHGPIVAHGMCTELTTAKNKTNNLGISRHISPPKQRELEGGGEAVFSFLGQISSVVNRNRRARPPGRGGHVHVPVAVGPKTTQKEYHRRLEM